MENRTTRLDYVQRARRGTSTMEQSFFQGREHLQIGNVSATPRTLPVWQRLEVRSVGETGLSFVVPEPLQVINQGRRGSAYSSHTAFPQEEEEEEAERRG